jgi:hypothetical protein
LVYQELSIYIFGNYVVDRSNDVSDVILNNVNVVLNNADNYYDNHSIKLLVDGVYFKKGYVLTNDQESVTKIVTMN